VECLPCETRSMFLWGGAYSSGVSRKEKEIETQRSRSVAIAALARR